MNKLLQLTTYGLKNIEKPVVLDFSNQTINKGISKINSVKGIYGYNGAGKTALITSVDVYRKILVDQRFLVQNETQQLLFDLINKKVNEFFFSSVFSTQKDVVVRHSIKLKKDEINKRVSIVSETFDVATGRTLNGKFKPLFARENENIEFKNSFENSLEMLLIGSDFNESSLLPIFVKKFYTNLESKQFKINKLLGDILLFSFYADWREAAVCTLYSDNLVSRPTSKSQILDILKSVNLIKEKLENVPEIFDLNDEMVFVEEFDDYEKNIKGLENFIKIFKPDLVQIKLEKYLDKNLYHIKKYFVYNSYTIHFDYESSGIKKLVDLYTYLKKCADGYLVFIDEIDVNLNAVYFKKLISYFTNFGKGQLVFTTHNLESMDSIKSQRRAINVLGQDGILDTWVGVGNRSPINDYMGGYFIHSPMNIEDFDFISIFEGK